MQAFKHLSFIERLMEDYSQPVLSQWNSDLCYNTLIYSIRDNLEFLLNSKKYCFSWNAHLHELESSMLNYGLDDFSGTLIYSPGAIEKIKLQIEETVSLFEKRLRNARIYYDNPLSLEKFYLMFRIEGEVHLKQHEPTPFFVIYDLKVSRELHNSVVQLCAGESNYYV